MKTNIIIAVLLTTITVLSVSAQNYTSTADGNWTAPAKWNNTSGWGTTTPPTDGSQGSGVITMQNNMTINTSYTDGSATLNVASGKTLTINGSMTLNGGSTVNVSGNLVVNGDLILYSTFNILPGGTVTINGKAIVYNSHYLIVGTSAAPAPYADLVVKSDIEQKSSGDVTLNRNARVAVFGKVVGDNSGGTALTLNQGAQMYVDGKVDYKGGGDDIVNNNVVSPFGLYVNSTVTNTGGGASTTSNKANKATMITTNVPFATWVSNASGSLMPVTLLFFEVGDVNQGGIALKWATASEDNFDHFIVESSNDGVNFNEIGRVQGHGTTKERHDYTFDVVNPAAGKSYYKLKSVDFDSYTETFKVISATYESQKSVKIFPNPVKDGNVNIDFNFSPSEEIVIVVTDLTGNEVLRQSINAMTNQLIFSIEAGTYLVSVRSNEIKSVSRLQVL